jgi:hypothetical protein
VCVRHFINNDPTHGTLKLKLETNIPDRQTTLKPDAAQKHRKTASPAKPSTRALVQSCLNGEGGILHARAGDRDDRKILFFFIWKTPVVETAHTGARRAGEATIVRALQSACTEQSNQMVTRWRCCLERSAMPRPFSCPFRAPPLHSLAQGFGNAGVCFWSVPLVANLGVYLLFIPNRKNFPFSVPGREPAPCDHVHPLPYQYSTCFLVFYYHTPLWKWYTKLSLRHHKSFFFFATRRVRGKKTTYITRITIV